MQLLDFALIGFAGFAVAQATSCPDLNNAVVPSNNQQFYRLDCGKWVDADAVLRIVETFVGYQGCLTACDGTTGCGIAQYVATEPTQVNGSCTLFAPGAPIKDGASNSWTLATKLDTPPPPAPPAPRPVPAEGEKFGLISIHSGSQVQNIGITASIGRLSVGGTQYAICDQQTNFATFYLYQGYAFLFTNPAEPQQIWVDASGMGQGITGYTSADQPPPPNAQLQGFSINSNSELTFNGISPLACPPAYDGAGWSLWFTTNPTPAGNQGCIGVGLLAIKSDPAPISCSYSPSF